MILQLCHIALAMSAYSAVLASGQSYRHDECAIWRNISNNLMVQDSMTLMCRPNVQCTGLDCKGNYRTPPTGGVVPDLNVEECFGIYLHPCANTSRQMSVYVELLSPMTSSLDKVFEGNDSVVIPGTSYKIGEFGSMDAVLAVTLVPKTINNEPYVLFGVQFKIRVKMGTTVMWPEGYQMTMVPDMLIPVPPCDRSVTTPKHVKGTCMKDMPTPPPTSEPTKKHPTEGPSHHLPSTHTPSTTSKPGAPCKLNTFGQCGNMETCDSKILRCLCITDAKYNKTTRTCMAINPTTTVIPQYPYPAEEDAPAKSVSKNVIIIAACSAGAVLIVAAVLVVIVLRYHAHRARYPGHQLLANDDFDDDPIDIAS